MSTGNLGSKVTPNKQRQLISKLPLAILAIVGFSLMVYLLLPNKTTVKITNQHALSPIQDATLAQNLELLAHMQRLEKDKPKPSPVVTARKLTPPKLKKRDLSQEIQLRMNAPTGFEIANQAMAKKGADSSALSIMMGKDANSQFIRDQSEITPLQAKKLPHPGQTVPAGEMIPATLETAIHSELAGMTRAITSRDVYALLGGRILIPKGSTLVGQFNASVIEGQSRVLVVWNRLQMPDGLIVTLNSPNTDKLGRSGQAADSIERHFFERFGAAALLSILGAYSATAHVGPQDQYNSASQYRINLANSLQQSAGQSLEKSLPIAPTLQINQGASIQVFVAHDLDFAAVYSPQIQGESS